MSAEQLSKGPRPLFSQERAQKEWLDLAGAELGA